MSALEIFVSNHHQVRKEENGEGYYEDCGFFNSDVGKCDCGRDEAAAELAKLKNKAVCGCSTPLDYHDDENVFEWCNQEPVSGICKEHWDKYMAQASTVSKLRLENAEMREALDIGDDALKEAEAILGGEYTVEFGPFFDMVKKYRAVLAKYPGETK